MTPRFVFLGTPTFAATVLQGLLDHSWRPELVITEPAKPAGRGLAPRASAVQDLTDLHHLPVATPAGASELTELLSAPPAGRLDLAIVVAYGKIIPAEALTVPTHGFVNVHASLLPKYRGASPIQAAILAGDRETGISFMVMEPSLDTGPVIAQVKMPIAPTDTTPALSERLAALAADTIVAALTLFLEGTSSPLPQDDESATYAPKLTKADGEIHLGTVDPITLDRTVRAFTPWPGVYTDEFAAGPEPSQRGQRLLVRSGRFEHGTYVITSLQWEGKPVVDGATFARGYPEILTALPQQVKLAAN